MDAVYFLLFLGAIVLIVKFCYKLGDAARYIRIRLFFFRNRIRAKFSTPKPPDTQQDENYHSNDEWPKMR